MTVEQTHVGSNGMLLRISSLTKSFDEGSKYSVCALDALSFDLFTNEWVYLLGANGSGKSTLLRILAGEMTPSSGTISWHMQDGGVHRVMHIEQSTDANLVGSMTVYENLALAAWSRGVTTARTPWLSLYRTKNLEAEFTRLMRTFGLGLEKRLHAQVRDLSGGEKQAVVVGKIHVQNPSVLLVDEFTSSLDLRVAPVILASLHQWKAERHATILAVTHDFSVVGMTADRIIVLDRGRAVSELRRDRDNMSQEALVGCVYGRAN